MRRRWSSASTCRRCPMCPPQLQCGWSPAFAQRIGRWAVRRALQGSGALRWRSPVPPQTAHTPTRRPKRPAWRPGAPRALEPQVERCKPTGCGASDARRMGAGRLTACCTGLFGGRPRPSSDAGAGAGAGAVARAHLRSRTCRCAAARGTGRQASSLEAASRCRPSSSRLRAAARRARAAHARAAQRTSLRRQLRAAHLGVPRGAPPGCRGRPRRARRTAAGQMSEQAVLLLRKQLKGAAGVRALRLGGCAAPGRMPAPRAARLARAATPARGG